MTEARQMNRMNKWIPFASLALSGLLSAQEPTPPAPKAGAETQQTPAKERSAADYVRDLGSDSFKARLQAEKALRAMGKDALPALREAAKEDKDAEAQWRARRLLRQIEHGENAGLDRRDDAPAPEPSIGARPGRVRTWFGPGMQGEDMERRFDEVFRGLERDFGMDIPRQRFFQDDFFKDLQDQMDALRKQMQGVGAGAHSQSQSMSMQVGPNGVRVEIKGKNEKGEEESKVYEAPDLDSFKQKYPGVLEEHGLQFSFGEGSFPFQGFGNLPRAFAMPHAFPQRLRHGAPNDADDNNPDTRDDAQPAPVDTVLPPPEGKRLGVRVAPQIPDGVRQYLGLAEGEGLQVEEVQPDTLASKLGVQKGDIVTRIGGATIGSSADVGKALGAIDAGKKVVVTVIRRGQELKLEAEKPAAPKADAGKLEKRAPTGKDAGGEIR
jgi:hypothetical protein